MKKIYFLVIGLIALNTVEARVYLDSENTELSSSNETIDKVYLKKGRDKIILKNDWIIFQRDYYNFNTKETYTFEKQLKNDGFNVALNKLQDLAKGQQVIDKAPIYINTFYSDKTEGNQMIYSNEIIEDLFSNLYVKYSNEINEYFNQLPSGEYTFSTFINRRLKENKSDFYKVIEKELIENEMVDEGIYKQPLIYINKVQSTFDEMNRLIQSDIKSYKVIKGESAIKMYGSSAKNGLIIIDKK